MTAVSGREKRLEYSQIGQGGEEDCLRGEKER